MVAITVTVADIVEREIEIDVEFPVYFYEVGVFDEEVGLRFESALRIEASGQAWAIERKFVDEDEYTDFTFESLTFEKESLGANAQKYLDHGSGTEHRFFELLTEMNKRLSEIPPQTQMLTSNKKH